MSYKKGHHHHHDGKAVKCDLTVCGDLAVVHDTFLEGSLCVHKSAHFKCNVDVDGKTHLNDLCAESTTTDSLCVTGETILKGPTETSDVDVLGKLNAEELCVSGESNLSDVIAENVCVNQETLLKGPLCVEGKTKTKDLHVDGVATVEELCVNQETYLKGPTVTADVEVQGELSAIKVITDELCVTGDSFLKNLDVECSLSAKDACVTGQTLLKGPTTTGDIDVQGGVEAETLCVTGTTQLKDSASTKDISVDGELDATKVTAGDLEVTGDSTLRDVDAANVALTNTLTTKDACVTGSTLLKNTLTVEGATAVNTLSANGTTDLTDLSVSGAATLTTLVVSDLAKLNGDLQVHGESVLAGPVISRGPMLVENTLDVTGKVTLNEGVQVGGALDVDQDGRFKADVCVEGKVETDCVVEKTKDAGVKVEDVLLKDNSVSADEVHAKRGEFSDRLVVPDTFRVDGAEDTITAQADVCIVAGHQLVTNQVSEKTSGQGVSIEQVNHRAGKVTAEKVTVTDQLVAENVNVNQLAQLETLDVRGNATLNSVSGQTTVKGALRAESQVNTLAHYAVNGTKVVGVQQGAIADLSLAPVGVAAALAEAAKVGDVNARLDSIESKLNTVLAALRAHGLIA
uniref:Uncharacterized protein n=1 Tax=viral metagenome TaxID=1070528 RepID=A0A6C0BMN0_9ZZZZ